MDGWIDRWIDMGEGDAVFETEGDREDRGEGEGERRARKARGKNGRKKAGKRGSKKQEGRLWGSGGRVYMRCCRFYCADEREKGTTFSFREREEGRKRRRRSGDSRADRWGINTVSADLYLFAISRGISESTYIYISRLEEGILRAWDKYLVDDLFTDCRRPQLGFRAYASCCECGLKDSALDDDTCLSPHSRC